MKPIKGILGFFLLTMSALTLSAWGFYAHKTIARNAIFTLPAEMSGFYKVNLEMVVEGSITADKRRYVDENEAANHYIDLDLFTDSIQTLRQVKLGDLQKQYGDSLDEMGRLPWAIRKTYYQLSGAFSKQDFQEVVRKSSDLAHYISDAHVPLHTVSNYNGQKTNQHGIHGLWESRIPELMEADSWDFIVGRAQFIRNINSTIWNTIEHSNSLAEQVLKMERDLSNEYPQDKKFGYEIKGQSEVRVFSEDYSERYYESLDGMIEAQMRAAVKLTGDFWYTAWVNAGQPELFDERKVFLRKSPEEKTPEVKSVKRPHDH